MVRECPRCRTGKPIDEMKNQKMCRRCRREVEDLPLRGRNAIAMMFDVVSRWKVPDMEDLQAQTCKHGVPFRYACDECDADLPDDEDQDD